MKKDRKEYMKEYHKQWRAAHRAERVAYNKQWYADNKTEKSEYMKQWYAANREKLLEHQKQYHKQHRGTLEGYNYDCWNSNVQADRKYSRIGEELPSDYITLEQRLAMIQEPCVYCGQHKPFKEMGIDRIDNRLPHTFENCVPCCTECNIKRKDRYTYDEFRELTKNEELENQL